MSAESEKLFRRLLRELRPLFKENGFRASGQSFFLESAECWVIINFQKSRWADKQETTFYVNVAASTKRWLGFHSRSAETVPPYYSCDWQWRAEHFGPDKNIDKWTLRDEDSLRQTFDYLQVLFREYVLPACRTMTTETELVKHTVGFEFPQTKTRCVIFAATNQVDALKQAVGILIGKFGSGSATGGVRDHLEMLRSKYPEAMRSVESN